MVFVLLFGLHVSLINNNIDYCLPILGPSWSYGSWIYNFLCN